MLIVVEIRVRELKKKDGSNGVTLSMFKDCFLIPSECSFLCLFFSLHAGCLQATKRIITVPVRGCRTLHFPCFLPLLSWNQRRTILSWFINTKSHLMNTQVGTTMSLGLSLLILCLTPQRKEALLLHKRMILLSPNNNIPSGTSLMTLPNHSLIIIIVRRLYGLNLTTCSQTGLSYQSPYQYLPQITSCHSLLPCPRTRNSRCHHLGFQGS